MELEQVLEVYSKKYGKEISELKTTYEEILDKVSKDKADPIRKRIALTQLTSAVKREKGISSATTNYEGMIISASAPEDAIATTMRISTAIYTKDPERAVREGYTSEDGVILDRRDWSMGKENEHKGQPLEGEDWRRTATGIAKKEGEDGFRIFTMKFYGDTARDLEVPVLKYCNFAAIEKKVDNKKVSLNASQNTQFKENGGSIDLETELHNLEAVTPLKDVDEWYNFNQKDRDAVLITEGSVYNVGRTPNDNGRRRIQLTEMEEPDLLKSFSIPQGIDLPFEEDSRVIVFGQVKPTGDGTKTWIDTLGIYPLPDYLIPHEEEAVEVTEPSE